MEWIPKSINYKKKLLISSMLINKMAIKKLKKAQTKLHLQLENQKPEEQQPKTISALAAVVFASSLLDSVCQKQSHSRF
jgi:hypothetical protein